MSHADDAARYVFWGFDGGFSWATGDGSDLWESGSAFGINLLYPIHGHLAIGARFGINRWALDKQRAVDAILPPGATLLGSDSSGEFTIVGLTPVIRATSAPWFSERVTGFVEADGGLFRVSFNAETVVEYLLGSQDEIVVASASGADFRGGGGIAAGLSFTLSKDSRLEIYPVYNFLFEPDGTTAFIDLLVAFRVEFGPLDKE